ncbi:MAG: ribosome maturation factor RimP [Propionibacteriaceae bacterium]|jgi:ribosome maturation factor RimP|nr:ribosome maturation factor RimP [Propionibacteriaceae bacterium]
MTALKQAIEPVLAAHGLELDDLSLVRAGDRQILRVTVDGDDGSGGGPDLDRIALASTGLSAALDDSDLTGRRPYVLEVSSRGIDRPLTEPRHWRRNQGRLVEVLRRDGDRWLGRLVGSDDRGAELRTDAGSVRLDYAEVARATVQVEFNRPAKEIQDGH